VVECGSCQLLLIVFIYCFCFLDNIIISSSIQFNFGPGEHYTDMLNQIKVQLSLLKSFFIELDLSLVPSFGYGEC